MRPPGHNWPLDHVLDSLLTGPLIAPGSDVVRNVQAHCNAIQWEANEEKCWAPHSSVSSRQACSPLGLEAQAVWWRSGPRRSYQSSHVEIFLRQCPQVLGQIYYWTLPHNSPVFRSFRTPPTVPRPLHKTLLTFFQARLHYLKQTRWV